MSVVTRFAALALCRPSVTSLRRFSGLRALSVSLAVCMLWSFVGAGTALAAAPQNKPASRPKVAHAPAFPKLTSPFDSVLPLRAFQPKPSPASVPQATLQASVSALNALALSPQPALKGVTLLDEVGKLARPVSPEKVAAWKRELKTSRPPMHRAAELHIWLGEYELAKNEQPLLARWHFRLAQQGVGRGQRLNGLAAYDDAAALYYEGAYEQAEHAFQALLSPKTARSGYDRRTCALWLRHAAACAGYHRQHAAQGIPEPPQLDPECGAAALAASLRALRLPYDHKTVLANCRVTGEGSTLQDLVDAGPKLGVSVRGVTADDQGLISLPKPLVAYVEQDHFISVVRADKKGVAYLCSDCGMWPGGEVELTWKQWHLLNPGVYATVTKAGSEWDKALARLPLSPSVDSSAAPRVASVGSLSHLFGSSVRLALGHVAGLRPRMVLSCGLKMNSQHCASYVSCPTDCGGHQDPVNLATGEEEYTPSPDLIVYNPHGPSVVWQRTYNSLRGENAVPYEYDDFGNGWSQTYNIGVYDPNLPSLTSGTSYTKYIMLPNGSRIPFTARAVPNSTPAAAPTSTASSRVQCDIQAGAPYLVEWDYDSTSSYGHYVITMADRTKWTTKAAQQSVATSQNVSQSYQYFYFLAQITDRNSNSINFNYIPSPAYGSASGYPLLSTITDASTGSALLTIQRNGYHLGEKSPYSEDPPFYDPHNYLNITAVTDAYGRSVYYQGGRFGSFDWSPDVTQVSQIVPTGAANPPARWTYTYQDLTYSNETAPFLASITTPSPTGSGTSTASILYNPSTLMVSGLQDGNGNTHTYTYGMNQTTVAVGNGSGTLYTSTKGFDSNMSQTTETDGAGHTLSSPVYSSPNDPYRPSQVTDGNGKTTSYTWDSFGNLLTQTPPSNATRTPAATVYHYNYSQFALGEMQWMQEGSKQKTTYAYFEPSGLVQSVTMPLPGTVGGTSTAVTSYTYDGLGNPLTIVRPGNNAVTSITTTLGYTTDGSYSQSTAIGQPVTVTDNLGKVTHLRYDAQGNVVGVKDALGNETNMAYTIGNEPRQTVLPATGQTGSGHGGSLTGYLYAEPSSFATAAWPAATLQYGPATTATLYDEGNVGAIRQTVTTYGKEGEVLTVTGSTEPVAYAYDALYRMKKLTDGGSHVTSYFYNPAGYLRQVVYPGAGTPTAPLSAGTADTVTMSSYDGAGNVLTRTDGNNVTTTYTYADPESLLTGISYSNGTIGNVYLTYDAYGRRSGMGGDTAQENYTYDDDDNLTKKSVFWFWVAYYAKDITYGFYSNGSRQSMVADGHSYTYSYDGVGRMTGLTNDYNQTTHWSYLNNGWLHSKTLGNGVTTTFTQDAQGRLRDLVNKTGSGTTLSDFAIPATGGYDGAGNRRSVTSTLNGGAPANYSGTTSYTYDYGQTANPQLNRSQVTGETSTRAGGYTNAFAYDGGTSTGPGNPTSFKGQSRTFNANNQQTGTGFGYDGNGNPTTYKGKSLAFDPENRLSVYDSAASSASYFYDADGHQVSRETNEGYASQSDYKLYDGDDVVAEYTADGSRFNIGDFTPTLSLTDTRTFGADGLVSQTSGNTTFYTYDERGNVAQRTSGTGAVLSSDVYDAYGGRTSTGGGDSVGFGGQWGYYTETETGLILCTHRYYDPQNGRWLTRDPIGYSGGVNLYGYVENDPVNVGDPTGYDPSMSGQPPVGPFPVNGTGNLGNGGTITLKSGGGSGVVFGGGIGGNTGSGTVLYTPPVDLQPPGAPNTGGGSLNGTGNLNLGGGFNGTFGGGTTLGGPGSSNTLGLDYGPGKGQSGFGGSGQISNKYGPGAGTTKSGTVSYKLRNGIIFSCTVSHSPGNTTGTLKIGVPAH